ncbi:MAG: hypothetical protein WAO08_16180, partial [Hyphomicrobiaceae bacterium]
RPRWVPRLMAAIRPSLALHDPVALVFGHGTEEGDKAAAEGPGEVQVRLVEHLMFVYLSSRCM